MNNRLGKRELKQLLLSHTLFEAGKQLFFVFVNLFIWNITNDIRIVALFNFVYMTAHTIVFTFTAYKVKKGRVIAIRSIGLVGLTFSFLLLLYLGQRSAQHIVFLSALFGAFNGMYWMTHHLIRFDLTHLENRSNYIGIEKSGRIIVTMLVPVLGGLIITTNLFGLGYGMIFILGALCMTGALVAGMIRIPDGGTPMHLKKTLPLILKNKDILTLFVSSLFSNIGRRGAIERLLPILIFDVLHNEFQLGGWLTMFATLSILVSYIVGKHLHDQHYNRAMVWSAGITFLSYFTLIGFPTFFTYIIFGIITQVVEPILYVTKGTYSQNLIHALPDYKAHRVEYLVIREWFAVGAGRAVGFIPLLFMPSLTGHTLQIVLLIMAGAILVETILLKQIRTSFHDLEQATGIRPPE